ncbi:protocadherin Fat 4-like [Haliotis rubra]|uniref:protocadherin Fat 4-like n=1 Tax=Haliotis rubra TaxID=36100 RepID=UPI001EE4F176|nr:protocadherin Fat 4-like [Haliotis rubra]
MAITNVPLVANVYEEETSRVSLTDIVCTHTASITVFLQSITPTTLCSTCFAVYKIPPSLNFQLFYLPSQGNLSYAFVPIYDITVTCTDGAGTSLSTVINVRVRTNELPRFDTFSVTVTTVNAKTTTNGAVIYTETGVTEPDGDAVFYNMTVFPESSTFKYEIGLTDGIIRATTDLSSECFPTLVFFIYVHDNRNVLVGPKVVTIQFSDYYRVPYIPGVNKELTVSEDTAIDSIISNIQAVSDPVATYTIETFPSIAAFLFTVNVAGTSTLRLRGQLDYEGGIRNINVTIIPSNGFCTPDIFFLYIKVADANDPPVISPRDIVTSMYEGPFTLNPNFTYVDQDVGDTATYSIIGGNTGNLFFIDSFSGVITCTNYDVDVAGAVTTVVLLIQLEDVKDKGKDNTTVTIIILDKNDNAPVITAPPSGLYQYQVEDCFPAGTYIGKIFAADGVDSAYNNNNVVECNAGTTGVLFVLPACDVILNASIPAGTVATIDVTASDKGTFPGPLTSPVTPVLVSSILCSITTTATTTTGTTTTPLPTTTTTPVPTIPGFGGLVGPSAVNGDNGTGNMPWIVSACILGCIGIAAAAFFISRYVVPRCKGNSSPRFSSGPSQSKQPVQPENRQGQNRGNIRQSPKRNNVKPVTPREVQPYEAYKDDQRGPNLQQKNVWRGAGTQPDKTFEL